MGDTVDRKFYATYTALADSAMPSDVRRRRDLELTGLEVGKDTPERVLSWAQSMVPEGYELHTIEVNPAFGSTSSRLSSLLWVGGWRDKVISFSRAFGK